MMQVTVKDALQQLNNTEGALFTTVLKHGSMLAEIYRPVKIDHQTPHVQDELYIIITGTGDFVNDGKRIAFGPGDVLFVPAGVAHRFENFTDDFTTWVIFYGPPGGEVSESVAM